MKEIKVECRGCGLCCINKADPKWIEVTIKDAETIPFWMLQNGDISLYAMKQDREGRCIALMQNNECKIYSKRPVACRNVGQDSEICLTSISNSQRKVG